MRATSLCEPGALKMHSASRSHCRYSSRSIQPLWVVGSRKLMMKTYSCVIAVCLSPSIVRSSRTSTKVENGDLGYREKREKKNPVRKR